MTQNAQTNRRSSGWKWLPLGCLGTVIVAVCILFFVFSLASRALKAAPPFRQAMSLAQEDKRVIDALGEPLEASAAITGDVSESETGGRADLEVHLFGRKGRGVLTIIANKEGDRWVIEKAEVLVEATGQRIDLLEKEPSQGAPADGP